MVDVFKIRLEPGYAAADRKARTDPDSLTPDEKHLLGDTEIRRLLDEMAREPVGADVLATETLLFHGAETRDVLTRLGPGTLPADHEA